ncbi:SH3 domain-containing protein [Anaerococcus sp. Marseille-P9784]|uniref:aggregation-promoting factor C-terminal-like domain-containing protein n=1 Tax=Anaerococcus sp. Marseille-P9784 TaxID=2614127 RepID=UPI00124A89FD|nr:SH3 domain-containing protein [Anaerococcus sp. Marseille-P9784]
MINFKKYILATALVFPSIIAMNAKESDAAKVVIDKNLANAVNVRNQASLGDNVMGLISDEEKSYEIKSNEGDWLKIDFNGKDAFVSRRYFHILGEDKIIAATNFRDNPTINSNVMRILQKGELVEVLEVAENGYLKVEIDGKIGYVYHNLLESFREKNVALEKNAKAKENKQAQQSQQVVQTQTNNQSTQANQQTSQEDQTQQEEQQQFTTNWAKEWIAQRESNGSYTAYNPRGGYYGRYQLNPSLIHYGASPAEQEAAADNYVYQRYGSWEAAQQFWASHGWY